MRFPGLTRVFILTNPGPQLTMIAKIAYANFAIIFYPHSKKDAYHSVKNASERRKKPMTLDQLPIGKQTKILAVNGQGALRRHLLDMGLTPKITVMVRKVAPMGDPMELHLRGYELTIRKEDARNIVIEEV